MSEIVEVTTLERTLENIRARIEQACSRCHRRPEELRLLPVTKGQPTQKLLGLMQLGFSEFAESYLQELEKKAAALPPGLRWIYIGRLQSNKIKRIVRICSEIQSVSSMRHARQIAACAAELGKVPFPIYLQVNPAHEASKSGVAIKETQGLYEEIVNALPELSVEGIMAIPPLVDAFDSEAAPPDLYRQLARLGTNIGSGKLSLGMSGDLEWAVAVGSHCLRIGTALLGERQAPVAEPG